MSTGHLDYERALLLFIALISFPSIPSLRGLDHADYRLPTLVHMDVLDPHELGAAVSQAAESLHLVCVDAQ